MSNYSFDLRDREVIDGIRSPYIYRFNLARNLALLSDDPAVIRYFYQIEAPKLTKDQWLRTEITDKFMAQYRPGQAYAYFGLIPMIVKAKVHLLSSAGFECASKDEEIDECLNAVKDEADLEFLFSQGVYWESGIGDVAYRISTPADCDRPIIDVIEPHHLEVYYSNGKVKSYVIKDTSDDDPTWEIHEIYYKNELDEVCITYRFKHDGGYIGSDQTFEWDEALSHFPGLCVVDCVLPFPDFPIEFKKNPSNNQLYRGERGVPDIQGLDTIEDALSESVSDLIDAIRKGGVKEYVDQQLIPEDEHGNQLRLDHFNKTIIPTKGSNTPGKSQDLWRVVQGDIKWQAYKESMQTLMSVGINKAGLSPTTLGITGLESINSSQESQDAREKPSMRTRELGLRTWKLTLENILNKYLWVRDYIDGKPFVDYCDLINVHFDEYINPSQESLTDVLARQVQAGIKSVRHAVKELNDGWTDEEVDEEIMEISAGANPVLTEDVMLEEIGNSDPLNANLESSDSINANSGSSDPLKMLNNIEV